MTKYAKCAVLATLLALVAIPATASAKTQWFYEREVIPPGETVAIGSSGAVSLSLKLPKQSAIKIPCTAEGVEAFWNSGKRGLDETRTIDFSCAGASCGRAVVTPSLPWTSTLLSGPLPLIDRWEGVALDLQCGGTDYGTFSGSLEAKVGDVDPPGSSENKDELDNVITFRGGAKRALDGPNGALVWFGGHYHLGTKGSGVGDE